jgi:hypothetical protein
MAITVENGVRKINFREGAAQMLELAENGEAILDG